MITADLLVRISLFASLPEPELATLATRAADVRLRRDEYLQLEGQAPAFYGLLEGRIDVLKSINGRDRRLTTFGVGDSFGEVPLLLGSSALVSLRAVEPSRVLRLEPTDFLQMVAHCRVLSGEVSRTMAARLDTLHGAATEGGAPMATVIGQVQDPACFDLREFLSRNRIPFAWREEPDGTSGPPSQAAASRPTPVVVLADGRRLRAPSHRELAEAVGLQTVPERAVYDVVIVGGGPAGLAAAVYGASEGLQTVVIERTAHGGQAGTSSRIENYLGFPGGLAGDELSARACQQARRFGAELLVTRSAVALEPAEPGALAPHAVVLEDGARVTACAMILATGVAWRHLDVPGIERLVGHGVYYGAARPEAMRMRGRAVHLVGGGNSAGQAALCFSDYAESVTVLVRGPSPAASMSQYLIDELAGKENVTIETGVELVGVEGVDTLRSIDVIAGPSRRRERRPSDGLFVFIGAQAETAWLPERVLRDSWGFVCTGRDVLDLLQERRQPSWAIKRDPYLLETSVPGVMAAGDVRHGSIKRVSAGVGEGSMAIALIHQYLAELRKERRVLRRGHRRPASRALRRHRQRER